MTRKNRTTKAAGARYAWLMGGLVVILIAVIVIRNLSSDRGDAASGESATPQANGKVRADGGKTADSSSPVRKSKRAELRKSHPRTEGVAPVFPMVEAILMDDRILDAEAATRFREIAGRADVSEAERVEALNHGLILQFEAFEGFTKDPALPVPLVQKYIEELANLSPSEAFRVSGLLDCLAHSDADIRKQSSEQLAEILENEELTGDPVALRREAGKYLERLKAQPKEP